AAVQRDESVLCPSCRSNHALFAGCAAATSVETCGETVVLWMNKSEKYYQELMTHPHVSRRGLFRAFVSAAKHTMPEVITTRLG
ncbi:hypothetical protein WAJ72_22325, partial [Acinetobacter baumannii]